MYRPGPGSATQIGFCPAAVLRDRRDIVHTGKRCSSRRLIANYSIVSKSFRDLMDVARQQPMLKLCEYRRREDLDGGRDREALLANDSDGKGKKTGDWRKIEGDEEHCDPAPKDIVFERPQLVVVPARAAVKWKSEGWRWWQVGGEEAGGRGSGVERIDRIDRSRERNQKAQILDRRRSRD